MLGQNHLGAQTSGALQRKLNEILNREPELTVQDLVVGLCGLGSLLLLPNPINYVVGLPLILYLDGQELKRQWNLYSWRAERNQCLYDIRALEQGHPEQLENTLRHV